jgi:hypothetical protein
VIECVFNQKTGIFIILVKLVLSRGRPNLKVKIPDWNCQCLEVYVSVYVYTLKKKLYFKSIVLEGSAQCLQFCCINNNAPFL